MTKRIFNSVGSNYTYSFALKTLFASGGDGSGKLTEYLDGRYKGKTTLFYKGREAILYALKSANLAEGSKVVVCGYTCAVVPTAVKGAGYTPIYADISKNSLDFDFSVFKNIAENDESVRAVVIQNTLGTTHDIREFEEYCKRKNIVLIEDLAHSAGAKYPCGREVGTVGDFTILSFSQDKIIDAVSGGALITRYKNAKEVPILWEKIDGRALRRDRAYPLRTWIIRNTYALGIGKFLHYMLRRMNLLSLPLYNLDNKVQELPAWYATLAHARFLELDNDIKRRRNIAHLYLEALPELAHSSVTEDSIASSTALRFPLFVNDRDRFVKHCASFGIYISDIWYDVPVSPKKFWHLFEKENLCVNSKKTASKMVNLPTHMTLTERDVKRIINVCKKYKE